MPRKIISSRLFKSSSIVIVKPFQNHRFETANGSMMVLSIVNNSKENSASFAASCSPIQFSDSGSLQPIGQKTYPPTDYMGNILGVANTTNPNKPANIKIFLGLLGNIAEFNDDPGPNDLEYRDE